MPRPTHSVSSGQIEWTGPPRLSPGAYACVGLLALVIVLTYPVVALYPYHWVYPLVVNSIEQTPEGSLRFARPGIAFTPSPPAWVAGAMRENKLTISLSVSPAEKSQVGPARIASLSADPWNRNFTVGQEGRDLILRLRTTDSDLNGLPAVRIPDLFRSPGWLDLRIEINRNELAIFANEVLQLRRALPPNALSVWDTSFPMVLGNERTGDRPWLGEIRSAQFEVGDRTTEYVMPGALQIPKYTRIFHRRPHLVPFENVDPGDAIINLVGFIPFGMLLGLWHLLRATDPSWKAVLIVGMFSGSLEILQLGIPGRYFSVDDLILNSLGGAIGLLLFQWLSRQNAAPGHRV